VVQLRSETTKCNWPSLYGEGALAENPHTRCGISVTSHGIQNERAKGEETIVFLIAYYVVCDVLIHLHILIHALKDVVDIVSTEL